MDSLIRDIKLAGKWLWKDRGFALTAVLTLGVCIGANTAIFTMVNSVLLHPLPVPDANNILLMENQYPNAGATDSTNSGAPDYYDRLQTLTVFDEQAMYNFQGGGTIDIDGTPQRVPGMSATPSLFRLLRVPPARGRIFLDSEGEIGNEQKVILSYGLWQQLFGGDANVLGRDLLISGRPYSIVGVMPRDFLFVNPDVRLWTPLAFTAAQRSDDARHGNSWLNIGRLRSGATRAQAQAQVDALNAANLERLRQWKELMINAGFHTRVEPLQDMLVRGIKDTLYLLWGGAICVLLIGAVNITNLALARSAVRRRDFATRLALGATRFRVARHVMVESSLLAIAGGAVGLLLGTLTLGAFMATGPVRIPRATEIHLDATVVLFAIGLTFVVGLLIGCIPLGHLWTVEFASVLREESRTGTTGLKARLLRRTLVVAQVGFAFVLLTGAGLLFASFRHLLTVDPGFKAEGVVTASLVLPRTRYPDDQQARAFMNRALDAIRGIPGVLAAGGTTIIPLGGNHNDSVILAEGYVMKPGESLISPMLVNVTPGYFEAMGTSLVRGRYFDQRDSDAGPGAVIVDERLARKFWPDSDPIGRRMYRPLNPNDLLRIDEHTRWLTVVGVIHEVLLDDLTGNRTIGAYYFPYAQNVSRFFTLAIKARTDSAAVMKSVRGEIAAIDPQLAVSDLHTMSELTNLSLMSRRAAMLLALVFSGVAFLLSMIGIYGVLAYLVTQRRREMGIRIALGSSRSGIFTLVLREGTILVIGGLLLGMGGAVALRRAIEGQMYGVGPMDPWVMGTVTLGLTAAALAACVAPARRATQIDPVRVLSA